MGARDHERPDPVDSPAEIEGQDSLSESRTRRAFLALCAASGVGALAGCPGGEDPTSVGTGTPTATDESAFARLYRNVIDSVTLLETPAGSGSGWVYDDEGRIVTNQHVVETADEVDVRYSRDEWRTATVLGTDATGDLAVVEPSDPPTYATPLPLASGPPAVGSDVAIVGAPFGLSGSLSVGVVSATGRLLEGPSGSSIPGVIQVDATANPGNSGGPILSIDGQVVGVLNSGGGIAVNFGIPARLVAQVIPALIETGRYRYASLGLSLLEVDPAIAAANDLDQVTGILVVQVAATGPADGRLRGSPDRELFDGRFVPVGGDVIVGLDDREITSTAGYASYLAFETRPGDSIEVTVLRDGERRMIDLEVGSQRSP